MNLLIIGAPGAGKGTMSKFIVDTYHVKHISTGDMLRKAIKDKTDLGLIAKTYIDKGELVSDSIINDLIKECLANEDMSNGFLFDGYPRNVKQAESLQSILQEQEKKIDLVINLNVNDEVLIKRIEGRRLCPNCGSSFNVFFSAPKVEGICDHCQSNLIIRTDDNAESVKVRLDEFRKSTQPVIGYYEKQNIVRNINANADRIYVFEDIKKVIGDIQ